MITFESDNILNQPEENSDEAPDSGLGFFDRLCEKVIHFRSGWVSQYSNPIARLLMQPANPTMKVSPPLDSVGHTQPV